MTTTNTRTDTMINTDSQIKINPGFDPVGWTPRKRGCSLWEVSVGSSLLSTRMRL